MNGDTFDRTQVIRDDASKIGNRQSAIGNQEDPPMSNLPTPSPAKPLSEIDAWDLWHDVTVEVKKRITGYGRATKGQVQATIKQLLRLAEIPRPDDVADGLALALCYLFDLQGLERGGRGHV
jgi:hypothetical protein